MLARLYVWLLCGRTTLLCFSKDGYNSKNANFRENDISLKKQTEFEGVSVNLNSVLMLKIKWKI